MYQIEINAETRKAGTVSKESHGRLSTVLIGEPPEALPGRCYLNQVWEGKMSKHRDISGSLGRKTADAV